MAYTDIDNGYMTCDQVNQNVAQTVRMTVRAPRIANRLFEKLEEAQAFVNKTGDTATATNGLILSVFGDTEEKNGIYQVEAVAINPGEVGRLKKIGGNTGLQVLRIVDIDSDLAGFKEESVYMCIVDRSSNNLSSLIFVFEVIDGNTQILWGHNGYYERRYNNLNNEWDKWNWYGYVDGYHTHKSKDITDSVSSLPASAEDKDKLVQAGAVEKYVKGFEQGVVVPTVDHKLIYSEDNKSLIAEEFILPHVYVVDNAADVEKCKSDIPAVSDTTNIIDSWRAYSNSQNMPEYGGGVSFEPDMYTPVGYSQGYKAWSQNKKIGYIRSDNVASEHNGYINPEPSDTIRFEVVLGIEDNAPSNRTPNTVTSGDTSSMGVWLVSTKESNPRYVERSGIKYYRDTTKDIQEGSRESGSNWRAWVSENNPDEILYGDYDSISTVSGGTKTFTASGDAYTKDAAPDGTTLHEASGVLSMLCINFDNHNFNTISIGARSYDVSKQTIVGGAYCPISLDRGRITYLGNEEENIVGNVSIIDTEDARNIVPYNFSGDTGGMSSFVKALVEYDEYVLKVRFTDINVCNTADKETALSNAKNWSYNGSLIEVNFKNKTYRYTDKFGNISTEEALPEGFDWSIFSEGQLHIMYHAIGMRGSIFMSTKSHQMMNVILNVEDNTVTRFNEDTWEYETYGGEIKDLIDVMHGSHMAYNKVTKKLWYSNGTNIYPIAVGSEIKAGSGITISDDGVISANPCTIQESGVTATKVGCLDAGTVIKEDDTLADILSRILFKVYMATLVKRPSTTITCTPEFGIVEAGTTFNTIINAKYHDGQFKEYTGKTDTSTNIIDAGCVSSGAEYKVGALGVASGTTINMGSEFGSTVTVKARNSYLKSTARPKNSDGSVTLSTIPAGNTIYTGGDYVAGFKYFVGYTPIDGLPIDSASIRSLSTNDIDMPSDGFVPFNTDKINISGGENVEHTSKDHYLVIALPYTDSLKFNVNCQTDLGIVYEIHESLETIAVKIGGGTSNTTVNYKLYTVEMNGAKFKNLTIQKK